MEWICLMMVDSVFTSIPCSSALAAKTCPYGRIAAERLLPDYLLTGHTSFYERYGWEFLCMVQGDGEEEPARMYDHKMQ